MRIFQILFCALLFSSTLIANADDNIFFPAAVDHAHSAPVIASRLNLNISYGVAADANGIIYAPFGAELKPLTVSFEVAEKKVTVAFLESAIWLRVVTESLVRGNADTVNTYTITGVNAHWSLTEKFSIGLAALKPLIRDSMHSTAMDWAQVSAAFEFVHTQTHKLILTVSPFLRTNIPYTGTGNDSQQLWLPVKLSYNYSLKRLTLTASATYIPIQNFTTETFSQEFVFGGGAAYHLLEKHDKYDLQLFFEGQLWVDSSSDKIILRDPLDLSSVLAGLRIGF